MNFSRIVRVFSFTLLFGPMLMAQKQPMTVEEYDPRSTLVIPGKEIHRSMFPFIDVHNHQRGSMSSGALDTLVMEMDKLNMRVMVNLSGGNGERLAQTVRTMKGRYPHRFVVFANIDFSNIDSVGFAERAAAQLERDV